MNYSPFTAGTGGDTAHNSIIRYQMMIDLQKEKAERLRGLIGGEYVRSSYRKVIPSHSTRFERRNLFEYGYS